MEYRESYEEWLKNPYFDDATKEELRSIADDDNEIKEEAANLEKTNETPIVESVESDLVEQLS